jgi:hypothetical protein
MFIDRPDARDFALRQEGNVYRSARRTHSRSPYSADRHGPPDGGRSLATSVSINIAHLTEGGPAPRPVYKHGPPDGGRPLCASRSQT